MIKKKLFILVLFLSISLWSQDQNKLYKDTLEQLNCMLKDSCQLSFKKAVISVENAYYNNRLDTIGFNFEINRLSSFTKSMVDHIKLKYQGRDSLKVKKYAALFSVVIDTIPIADKDGVMYEYIPYTYDFEDIWGLKNWDFMFVSKLLETGKGNCHSLPYLYKILAEEIGADAHLAIAPNHIYVKHQNEIDGWYNTELTSGIFPNDAWLMASGYIHLDAITNKMYMEALTDKQSVSMCIIDLAQGYNKIFPDNNGEFVMRACQIALQYYPHYINGRILQAETKKKIFEKEVKKDFDVFTKEVSEDDYLRLQFLEIQHEYVSIHESGYRRMPEKMYLDWLTSLKKERKKYENKKITNPEKSN
ncbi:hypothetical protein [Aquimarina megaterium]|uniref:hypothetical protein n=1 Tax=Aquimarina megaterium TaxID=1443666 RepID=UPI0004713C9F|nr:hypothetical protein [Aquimarina megaterium]